MATLSKKPNRFYPSIPGIDNTLENHSNALRQMRESIETHERRNNNYLKSFVRFEELVALGIIDSDGLFVLGTTSGSSSSSVENLTDLTDVTTGTPSDNQILGYDFSSALWTSQTAAELGLSEVGHTHAGLGALAIDDLTDVATAGGGQYDLLYQSGTGWVPTAGGLKYNGTNLYISDIGFVPDYPSTNKLTIEVDSLWLDITSGIERVLTTADMDFMAGKYSFDSFATARNVVAIDATKFLISTSATPVTATIMADEFTVGDTVSFYQFGEGQLTIAADTGVTINTPSTLLINEQYGTVVLVMEEDNQWFIAGRLQPTAPMALADLADVVSAENTSPYVLVANGTTGYVGRALVAADIADFPAGIPIAAYGVDDRTMALLRFNETSGSTSTVDEASRHTPTLTGDAVISDAVQLSGLTNTLLLDGTGDYLSLASSADFSFGTAAFTVEFWFYRKTDITANIVSWGNTTQGAIYVTAGDTDLYFQSGGTERMSVASAAPLNAWVHVAFVRDGAGTDSLYVGGDLWATDATNESFDQGSFEVGRRVGDASALFNGHVDLLRISDTMRYFGDFDPPMNSTWLGTGIAEVNDLTAAVVWDDIPIANVPTGITDVTVALGDHLHTGVYAPLGDHQFKNTVTKAVDYILTTSDSIVLVNGTYTQTLPTAVGITGRVYTVKNIGTGTVTVDGDGTETIDGETTVGLLPNEALKIVSDGTGWWIV